MRIGGCDYVSAPPVEVAAAGFRFACRYLSTPSNAKNLTAAERDALRTHGVAIVLVFETEANRALYGAAAGRADAASAAAQQAALGMEGPIYFAVDFDPAPLETPAVLAYFAAIAAERGADLTGAYGGGNILAAIGRQGTARYFWQSASTSFGPPYGPRQLQQAGQRALAGGHLVDVDTAFTPDYGQWPRPRRLRRIWATGYGLLWRHGTPLGRWLAKHLAPQG